MHSRRLGKTGYDVSTISFGAWATLGTWGEVSEANVRAADLPPLSTEVMQAVQGVYNRLIRPQVQELW